jgi:putative endonuclease
MFHIYVLRSERTGRRYVGSCEDLKERLHRHSTGQAPATKAGRPWNLVHSETFATRPEAVRRERFLKTGRGRDELDRLERNTN